MYLKLASGAKAKTIRKQSGNSMAHAFSLVNEKTNNNNNISSGGRGVLFPTISCWVQAPVEKETQKPLFGKTKTIMGGPTPLHTSVDEQ